VSGLATTGDTTVVRFILPILAALGLVAAAVPPAAQPVGQAVAVVQNAQLTAGGRAGVLQQGSPVALGDVIQTDGRGVAQLLFADQTRIAVGPNSRLVVQEVLFRQQGTAQRFVVDAVAGSFRFISGDSPASSYAIRTPTATMSIRGTSFDLAVGGARGTDLVLFEGEVEMCPPSGRCAIVRGACNAVYARPRSVLGQVTTRDERTSLIRALFPFIVGQQALRPEFQAPTDACGDVAAVAPRRQPVPQIQDSGEGSSNAPSESPSDGPSGGGPP
jgi:hypothetical protein